MKYSEFYKIMHRRNKYNVKFLAEYLALHFPLHSFDFDSLTGVFTLDRDYLMELDENSLNNLSRVISGHAYYDSFVDNKFKIIPLLWKK